MISPVSCWMRMAAAASQAMISVAGSNGSSSLERLGQTTFSGRDMLDRRSPTISSQDWTSAIDMPARRRSSGSSNLVARSPTATALPPVRFCCHETLRKQTPAWRARGQCSTAHLISPDPSAHAPQLAERLLDWYDRHHRDLPWRISPRARAGGTRADPYRVWLSEIMLQQTTVATVKGYYRDFLDRWPDVGALAAAETNDVMKAWAGLGYYSRARNLKKCAETVVSEHGGRFPDTEAGLAALPGIGPYTAAAIAAIAFDRPAPVVDGNVERVFTRIHAIETPLPAAKPEIRAAVSRLVPVDRPGDFAQATMDLGATLCTPKRPQMRALSRSRVLHRRPGWRSGALSLQSRKGRKTGAQGRGLRRGGAGRRRAPAPPS